MKDKLYTIGLMILLTAVATALLTGGKLLLAERINRNEALRDRRTVLRAFGMAPESADAVTLETIFNKRIKSEMRDGKRIYYAYADDGKALQSVGFEFAGQGFWGPIRGILAVNPDRTKIVGLAFLSHQETPGLGGRMTEPWFRNQFKGKSADEPNEDGQFLVFRPEDAPAEGANEVNAISGATRTSDSLDRILNDALAEIHATPNETAPEKE